MGFLDWFKTDPPLPTTDGTPLPEPPVFPYNPADPPHVPASNINEVYAEICRQRREAWAEHVARMHVSDYLREWAKRMEHRFRSPTVQVWANELPWITALLVVRYGEDVSFWPGQFSTQDQHRAEQWFSDASKTPQGVRYKGFFYE